MSQNTNTIHEQHKYNTDEEQIMLFRKKNTPQERHIVNVYLAFWTEDREQIPRLGGMARFSLAPYFPCLSQDTDAIQIQNKYNTQTEQIHYKRRTNIVIDWYAEIFISPILPLLEPGYRCNTVGQI